MSSQAQAAALQQQTQQQVQQQTQAQQQSQQQQQPQQTQLSYSVIPQMQTVNIDGQEALFIPAASAAHQQVQPTMQFTTANGQQLQLAGQQIQLANGQTIINPHPVSLIRAPNVFPTSIIQNINGQTVQLPTG